MCVLTQDLKEPDSTYRRLGAKMIVGMPFKDIATSDTLFLPQLPPSSDTAGRRALKRLQVGLPVFKTLVGLTQGSQPAAC